MADHPVRGSVTPLASIFPAEGAHKAAKRVQEAISDHQKELHRISHFASENKSLINLVQRLPNELSHEIMVPFGKAAFFPGRLIHTNEFMVLLGENYYVERSAKQTVEILQRRGKTLDSQVESLKTMMTDLDAEAKFFSSTAVEAEEGLVEIREDYVEDVASENKTESGNAQISDEEYARIMSRLDELEFEEKAVESASTNDDEDTAQKSLSGSSTAPCSSIAKVPVEKHHVSDVASVRRDDDYQAKGLIDKEPSPRAPRAFTGSVVERRHGLSPDAPPEAPLTSSSKPVSRFKMRRGNS